MMPGDEDYTTPMGNIDVVTEGKKLRARQDAMQKKTFTKWYNSYLVQRNLKVDDLFEDLKSGVVLHNLLEILSNEKINPKVQPSPRFNIQKLENLTAALNFIKKKNIEISTIGPSDINAGNELLILGLSWMLILRFEVQKFSADIQELLRWCKKRTDGYPNVKVDNFTNSFRDGMALNALIHKHAPHLVNFDELNPNDAINNINNAMDIAEREFGVPKLLDANDLASTPDEKSVITYVARLRQAFADKEEEMRLADLRAEEEARRRAAEEEAARRAAEEEARRRAEEEARRRAEEEARRRAEEEARRRAEEEAARKAAEEEARRRAEEEARRRAEEEEARRAAERKKAIDDLNDLLPHFLNRAQHEKETDDLIENFNLRAKDLADWIKERDQRMADDVNNNTLGDTPEEVQDKLDHIKDQVPEKETEKLELESLNNRINTRLKLENRPRPHHEVPMEEVNRLWNKASNTEQGYKKALLDRLDELKRIAMTLERFRRMAQKLDEWINMCAEVMNRNELGDTIVDTTELIAEHERFSRDVKAQTKIWRELHNVAKLLPRHPEVESTMQHLTPIMDPLPARCKERMDALQKELVRQKEIERQRLVYFENIRDFEESLFTAEEYALNPLESDTEAAIVSMIDSLKRLNSGIKLPETASSEEEGELQAARARFEGVIPLLESRRTQIRESQQKKKQAEDQQQKFARTASQFASWYQKMANMIAEDATTELMRQRAKTVQQGLGEGQAHLNNAAGIQATIDSLGMVGPNPFTVETIESMENQYNHLKTWADERADQMQNPLPATNAPQVVKNLDILTSDKGTIPSHELSQFVSQEAADFIANKTSSDPSGDIEYAKFNPYPEANVPLRRTPSNLSAQNSPRVPSQVGQSPQEQRRSSYYASPGRSSRLSMSGAPSPAYTPSSPVVKSPPSSFNTPYMEDDSNLPQFDDSMRKKKELEENLFLYTTQTSSSPLAVRYEIECSKYEVVEFRVSFEGSENIKLLKPANGTLTAVTETPAFQTRIAAIVQQIDPYKPASLRTKYSWTSHVPQ